MTANRTVGRHASMACALALLAGWSGMAVAQPAREPSTPAIRAGEKAFLAELDKRLAAAAALPEASEQSLLKVALRLAKQTRIRFERQRQLITDEERSAAGPDVKRKSATDGVRLERRLQRLALPRAEARARDLRQAPRPPKRELRRPGAAGPSAGVVTFSGTGGISGNVSGPASAWVALEDSNGAFLGWTPTDPVGDYTITALAAGTYYVKTFNDLGFIDEAWDDMQCSLDFSAKTECGAFPITVFDGATTSGIDFALAPGGRIAGVVTAASTSSPIADLAVEVYNSSGRRVAYAYTDPSGAYISGEGLPSDTYFVRTRDAGSKGFVDEIWDDVRCGTYCYVPSGTPVSVTSPSTTTGINFALGPAGTISGRVTDSTTGLPLAYAGISVWEYGAAANVLEYAETDASGYYTTPPLPVGTYSVSTDGGDYVGEVYGGSQPCPAGDVILCGQDGTPVSVTAGATTPNIDFGLEIGGAVSGHIRASDTGQGIDMGGGYAAFANQYVSYVFWVNNYPNGEYHSAEWGAFPAGTYYVQTFNDLGYTDEMYDNIPCPEFNCSPTGGTPVILTPGNDTRNIDFVLSPSASSSLLTVSRNGTGTGTVTSTPAGISCGSDCSESFSRGASITLSATPAGGSTFMGWSGACTGTGSCQVTMNGIRSVESRFDIPGGAGIGVTSPGGGTQKRGTSLPIAWTSTLPTTYDLELWKGQGRYQSIAGGVSGASYGWTLPATLPLGSDYRVRVADRAAPTSYAFSAYFTVSDAVPAAGKLRGTVTSSTTGAGIPGASVECGFWKVWTAATGSYLMVDLPPNTYSCTASASGFEPSTFYVTIPSGGDVRRDAALKPVSVGGSPRVLSVTHKWRDFVYLLPAVPAAVDLTATVDWAGRAPGSVVFSVAGNQTTVPANGGNVVTAHFNGADMAGCTDVRVWARASDGTTSAAVVGPFATMTRPSLVIGEMFSFFDRGDQFLYKTTFKYKAIDEEIEGADLPSDIPAFGGNAISFRFEPKLSAEVSGAGKFKAELEPGTFESAAFFKVAGLSFNKLQPRFFVTGQYAPCGWAWSGGAELSVNADLRVEGPPSYFPIPTPFGPIPGYFVWGARVELPVRFAVKVDPFGLNGVASPKVSVRGTLGVGVDRILSVEGWVSGNADLTLRYPSSPHFGAGIYVTVGVSLDAVGFTWENQLWRWDLIRWGANTAYQPSKPAGVGRPQLVSRDYLRLPGRPGVIEADVFARDVTGGRPWRGVATSVAISTLPHPEPDLSAAGSSVYGAWLVDDPARAAINRTKVIFSSFDGTSWSAPVAIADDGTADFSPRVLAFADGKAWVVWQDANAVLSDAAPFEDMVKAQEISAALYDPAYPGFAGSHRLTANPYLDATPRLSGPAASDVVAVWITNPADALLGTAAAPNTVQASWWNGTAWSAAETVAQVGYPILRSELYYDGTSAFLVMSVDTDGNTETIDDQELALVRHTSDGWQPMEWLTSNAVVDANPRLVVGPGGTGTVLAWVQGDALKVAADFALEAPTHTLALPFSTNVADFRLTRSGDGRMAIVWTKPSEFSSDIWGIFYDPATGTWGEPQQLTADEATEKETAPLLYGGSLISLYARRDLVTETRVRPGLGGQMVEYVAPQAGPTDLVMVKTILGEDVALVGGSFTVDPPNPAPGVPVTLSATATNLGELPLGGSAVAFYNGDPGAGGEEVGRAAVSGPVATGGQVPVSFAWTVSATTAPLVVYAVVDPDGTTADRDRSNNVQQLTLALPDLQVSDAGTAPLGETTVSVVARVTNNGSTPAAASDFKFRLDSATGAVLHQETVPALAVGQSVDVGFVLGTAGLANGSVVVALSDEGDAVAEYDETNNSASLSVSLQPPSVDVGVTLQDAPDPVVVGADLAYTAVVANAGPDTANGVTLTMPVPAGATFVSALATQGDCSEAGGTITCTMGLLTSGGQATVTVTVRPGATGTLPSTASVFSTETDADANNNTATASTTVTEAGLGFYTVTPCRVVDSRNPTGLFGGQPLQARVERSLVVAGACGIPATAKAVSLNLTATAGTADGHLRLYPGGTPTPGVSTLNFRAGQTRANNAIAVLGAAGDLAIYAGMASGSVHVILDVNGYME